MFAVFRRDPVFVNAAAPIEASGSQLELEQRRAWTLEAIDRALAVEENERVWNLLLDIRAELAPPGEGTTVMRPTVKLRPGAPVVIPGGVA